MNNKLLLLLLSLKDKLMPDNTPDLTPVVVPTPGPNTTVVVPKAGWWATHKNQVWVVIAMVIGSFLGSDSTIKNVLPSFVDFNTIEQRLVKVEQDMVIVKAKLDVPINVSVNSPAEVKTNDPRITFGTKNEN